VEIVLREDRLPILRTRRLTLRDVTRKDVSPEYIKWLNDPVVTRHLEIRFAEQTPERVRAYVDGKLADTVNTKHFGVYEGGGERLVGTVTFPCVNHRHSFADVSFVIGHPDARGKGYATEAVHGAICYMFRECGIVKIWGGYYEGHSASARVFEKNGFRVEGRLKRKLVDYRNERVDQILVGLLAEDFRPREDLLGALPPSRKEAAEGRA
jgi:RimJ/RimL family protein N-acetyltransferase